MAVKVVAEGTWEYGGAARKPVWIARAEYDFWYELGAADGDLEPGETPSLNEDGVVYYVAFRDRPAERFWPDSAGYPTIEAAQRAAEQRVPGSIEWRGVED